MRGRRWHKRHPNRHFIVSVYATRHRVQVDLWTHSWVWERPVKWALDPMQAGRRREATQEYRSRGRPRPARKSSGRGSESFRVRLAWPAEPGAIAMTTIKPQLATPTELRVGEGEGVERSVCKNCGRDVKFDPSDFRPAWFHVYSGGRVCGLTPAPGGRPILND